MEIGKHPDGGDTVVVGLERPPIPSPERWSRDPFDSFPIEMQPHMHDLLCLYTSAAADYLYPIEAYWGFNPTQKIWVPLALTDPALLSSILFSSQQFEAKMNGRKERPSAINHMMQAIRALNQRLQDPLREISDSTIAAVAGLALTEQSSGRQENWRVHMRGIERMVEMRGGMSTFKHNLILYDKLCRADICGSIYSLSKPYLQMDRRAQQPQALQVCHATERALAPGFQALHNDHGLDSQFLHILYEVHSVTRALNTVDPPKSEVIPLMLRGRIRAIQYGLLSGEDYGTDASGGQLLKACRLSILLYVGIIQKEFLALPMSPQLIDRLKGCLQVESFTTDSKRALRLWLLFLAGSLVLDPVERSWFVCSLAEAASQLCLSNWCEARVLLEDFAWVAKIQDKSGRDMWGEAMRMRGIIQE